MLLNSLQFSLPCRPYRTFRIASARIHLVAIQDFVMASCLPPAGEILVSPLIAYGSPHTSLRPSSAPWLEDSPIPGPLHLPNSKTTTFRPRATNNQQRESEWATVQPNNHQIVVVPASGIP